MKRTPLRRNTPLRSNTPIKPVSAKRAKLLRQRSKMIRDILEQRTRCQAGHLITSVAPPHSCQIKPVDIHEPLTRARGGSIIDPANALAICRACHDWIHGNPAKALELGLLKSRYT